MSQSVTGVTRTFQAGGSVNAYKAVRLGATDNVVHQNTSTTVVSQGVTLHSASANENVTVVLSGTAKCVAVAAITRNATVVPDTAGKCRTTTTANDKVLGIALESTAQTLTSAGTEIIEIDLTPRGSNF